MDLLISVRRFPTAVVAPVFFFLFHALQFILEKLTVVVNLFWSCVFKVHQGGRGNWAWSFGMNSSGSMRPVVHPPDAVLQAYADLLKHVFLFLRGRSHEKVLDQGELFDLADALHNIGAILVDYGAWTDDERYRRLYLRPFDRKWGNKSLQLEQFLQSRLDEHSKR